MARIEHFAVYSDDPTALKDFYVRAFGLHVIVESGGDPPGYFLADDHGMAIEVLGRPSGSPEVNQRWVCHLAFWVEDVLAKKVELERRRFHVRGRDLCRQRSDEDGVFQGSRRQPVPDRLAAAGTRKIFILKHDSKTRAAEERRSRKSPNNEEIRGPQMNADQKTDKTEET